MPNTPNPDKEAFAAYDAMTTEELRQLLREDASNHKGEKELSTDALLYIMQVLVQRTQAQAEEKTPEEALEEFRTFYINEEPASDSGRDSVMQKKKFPFPRWAKALSATAAVLVLLLTSAAITAKAFGQDPFEIIAHWTKDTFYFGPTGETLANPDPKINNALPQMQAELNAANIQTPLVPTWLPEGYSEQLFSVYETNVKRSFYSMCAKDADNAISVTIEDYVPEATPQIEQSGSAEIYEINGVRYYIFPNVNVLNATWIRDGYYCCITGPVTLSEIKQMIDSIEKG